MSTTIAAPPVEEESLPIKRDRLVWLWLILGAALLPFTAFQWIVPVAGWLAPIFLLRFTRQMRPIVGLPVIAAVGYLGALVALWGVWPAPDVFIWAIPGSAAVLTYGADRLLETRVRGLGRTLVLPASETAVGFLAAIDTGSALGSVGAVGYTQVANIPLLQTASVLGAFGIGFLMMWTAAVVNECWEHGFSLRSVGRPLVVWAGVMSLALVLGGLRVALASDDSPTVEVAAIAPNQMLDLARDRASNRSSETSADRSAIDAEFFQPVIDDLLAQTRSAAGQGAQIVAWSEAAAIVYVDHQQRLLETAAQVASDEGVYLEIGVVTLLPEGSNPRNANQSFLFGPDGRLLWEYDKATVVPGDGNGRGPGVIPVVETPFGTLAVAICFDADFPSLIAQVGRQGVDILLVPSSDWEGIAGVHADMVAARSVENGVSVVRPTRRGHTIVTDPFGRVLGFDSDPFVDDDAFLIAEVPMEGERTLFPIIGDSVGWGSLLGVLLAGGVAIRRRAGTVTNR